MGGKITPDSIIRQELIFTLVSIGQKSGHSLASGPGSVALMSPQVSEVCLGREEVLPSSLDGMAGGREATVLHHTGLISAPDKAFHREEGGQRDRSWEAIQNLFSGGCALSSAASNWSRGPTLAYCGRGSLRLNTTKQARLIDSHLPDWKPATSPHNQCDDSKNPHILSATPFFLEQEESHHPKVREGAWV